MIFADRRRSARRPVRAMAQIQFDIDASPRDCMIVNISDGGIRIIAENLDIPAEFTITMSEGGPRQCRLVWRIGCEFGAEYLDSETPQI
jgi:hypothetical protein